MSVRGHIWAFHLFLFRSNLRENWKIDGAPNFRTELSVNPTSFKSGYLHIQVSIAGTSEAINRTPVHSTTADSFINVDGFVVCVYGLIAVVCKFWCRPSHFAYLPSAIRSTVREYATESMRLVDQNYIRTFVPFLSGSSRGSIINYRATATGEGEPVTLNSVLISLVVILGANYCVFWSLVTLVVASYQSRIDKRKSALFNETYLVRGIMKYLGSARLSRFCSRLPTNTRKAGSGIFLHMQ